MKKIITILVVALAFTSCKTSNDVVVENLDKKACKYFIEQITVVEAFNNETVGYGIELQSASRFLEGITEIRPEGVYNYTGLGSATSTIEDLNQWKSWFSKNKHLLYWDSEANTVKVKRNDIIVAMR